LKGEKKEKVFLSTLGENLKERLYGWMCQFVCLGVLFLCLFAGSLLICLFVRAFSYVCLYLLVCGSPSYCPNLFVCLYVLFVCLFVRACLWVPFLWHYFGD
jgi:hypothetical protein